MRRFQNHRVPVLLVALITLAGGALRFWKLGHSCLWLDEVVTNDVAKRGLRAIVRYTGDNIGPRFLSFFFEYLSLKIADNEFCTRLPTAIFGTMSIPLAAFAAWLASRRPWAGVLAAVLLAFSNHHLYYSREARGYALLGFLALAAFVATLKALRHDASHGGGLRLWATLAAIHLAGLFTSYFHAFLMAALAVYGLAWIGMGWRRGERSRRAWAATAIRFCLALLIPALAFLPWAWHGHQALAQYGSGHAARVAPRIANWLGETFAEWMPGNRWRFVVAAALAVWGGVFADRRRRLIYALFVALMVAVPAIVFKFVSFGHFLHPRYLLAAMPFFWVAVAIGLARLPGDLARLARRMATPRLVRPARWMALAAVMGLTAGYLVVNLGKYGQWAGTQKQDWRSVAQYLKAHYATGEIIVPSFDMTWICLAHYLPPELKRSLLTNGTDLPDNLGALARSGRRIWYVAPEYCLWEAPELEAWLEKYFERRAVIRGWGFNVRIYYFGPRPAPLPDPKQRRP
jgi:hypothetical protein